MNLLTGHSLCLTGQHTATPASDKPFGWSLTVSLVSTLPLQPQINLLAGHSLCLTGQHTATPASDKPFDWSLTLSHWSAHCHSSLRYTFWLVTHSVSLISTLPLQPQINLLAGHSLCLTGQHTATPASDKPFGWSLTLSHWSAHCHSSLR